MQLKNPLLRTMAPSWWQTMTVYNEPYEFYWPAQDYTYSPAESLTNTANFATITNGWEVNFDAGSVDVYLTPSTTDPVTIYVKDTNNDVIGTVTTGALNAGVSNTITVPVTMGVYDLKDISIDITNSVSVTRINAIQSALVEDVVDSASCVSAMTATFDASVTDTSGCTNQMSVSLNTALSDSANITDSLTLEAVAWFYESVAANDQATSQMNTSMTVNEAAVMTDMLVAAFDQLVAESASGSDTWFLEIGAAIVEMAVATGLASGNLVATQAMAETIVALDLLQQGQLQEISENVNAADVLTDLVKATQMILEQATAQDATTSYALMLGNVAETATAVDTVTSWLSAFNAIEEGATAFVRLSIGGELFTGWVMNTQSGAVTEYQGLRFNSLCRLGGRYYGATETGLYELAGGTDDGASISTYIQSGLLDFGSTQQKAVTTAYLGVDVDGRIAVGVGVSEKGGVAQHWYEVSMDKDAPDNVKLPIGRGLSGRYWKFEVASEALSTFDALTVLPVVLTRRA